MDDVRIKVEGMTCQHCQKRVNDAIVSVNGVTMVNVDLEAGEATVSYDCHKTDLEHVKQAVRDADYQVVEEEDVCPVPAPEGVKLMTCR